MYKEISDFVFEFGKILLKVEISKSKSTEIIRELSGDEKEEIILQKIGKFWNQKDIFDRPDGLVIITNERFVFLSKAETILTQTEFLSFPLEFMNNYEMTKVMWISPAIKFEVNNQLFMFTFFSNSKEIFEAITLAKTAKDF